MALSLGLSVVGFAQFGVPEAKAVVYTWDSNGATAGFGAAGGTWAAPTTGSPGWTTDPAGATVPGTVTTTTADALNFGTATLGLGTGTITVSGTVAAGSLTYGAASGAITLSGGTITLGTTGTGGITNNSPSVQIFNTNIALGVSQTWTLGAGATFNNPISGAFATIINSTGTVTLAADNSGATGVSTAIGGVNYTESFRLNTGTTIVGTSTSLGGTGTAVDIRSALQASTALTGANKLTNTFVIGTGTATINGANNIELGGSFISSNGGTAPTLAVTNLGTTTVSGTVSLSDSATVTKGLVVDVSGTAGATTISGVIQNFTTAGSGIAGNLAKTNIGTLILTNNNTYTGSTVVAGTLVEDFSNLATPTNIISGSSALTLVSGTLILKGQSASTTSQTFASVTLSAGTSSVITVNQNGATALNLTLNGITRSSQSALDITLPTAGTVTTTATGGSGGLLGDGNNVAYGTANGGTTWLAKTGTTPFALSALATYSTGNANYVTGNNIDVANGDSVSGVTVNTLRFNGANLGLTLAGTNIVSTGGLLVTPGSTGNSLTGGTITSSTGAAEVIIHDYGSLNVGSSLVNANAGAAATKLTLTGSGTTTLSGANTYTGATSVNSGRLNVTGSITASTTIAVGSAGALGAALYQSGSGSVVTNTNAGGGGFQIGSATYASGYYNLAAGTINVAGEIDPGGSAGGVGTFGQLDVSGGTINLGTASATAVPFFLPVRGAAGEASVVNISGGTVQVNSGNTVANSALNGLAVGLGNVGSLTSTITISGTGQFLTPALTTKLNDTNFGASAGSATNASVLNLNGGTLQTLGFGAAVNSSTFGSNNAVINLNGGTIRAGSAGNTAFLTNVGAVNVYSGGGTINNNGQAITVGQSLLAASGTGVTSVAVGTAGTGYIAPPRVVFSGGTLTSGLLANAATGYATIDPVTGTVTGIVITSPGSYTSTSGLTVSLAGPTGGTTAALGALALNGGNTSGGMTYLGAGTTTLSGASTYTGGTSISVGTVKNGVANTIPAASLLTVSGGTYDLNAFSDAVGGLSDGGTSAGIVTNSSATVATLTTNTTTASTYSGLLSGALALTQSGNATQTISRANNSYTGNTVIGVNQNGAVLRAAASGALGGGTIILDGAGNASTARFELTGGITLVNAITFSGRNNASVGIENVSGANTLSGLVTLGTGGGTYIVQSDADTLAFTNTGSTAISGNKTLTFTGAGNGSFAGALTSVAQTLPNIAGSIAKSGAGTWTLTGVNTYLGPTAISGGILSAASTTGNALGSTSGIVVNGGGTLLLNLANQVLPAAVASTATPAAAVTLGVAATSVGNVTAAAGANQGSAAVYGGGALISGATAQGLGALTLNNTATLTYSGASTTLVFNTFTPNGNVLTISGYVSANFNSGSLTSGSGTDDRLVFFGDQSGNYANFNFGQGAGVGVSEVALDGGFYEIGFSAVAVPEPATWLSGFLVVGAAGYSQRRRWTGRRGHHVAA